MDRNVLSYPSYIVHFILGEVPRLCLNIHQVTSEPLTVDVGLWLDCNLAVFTALQLFHILSCYKRISKLVKYLHTCYIWGALTRISRKRYYFFIMGYYDIMTFS